MRIAWIHIKQKGVVTVCQGQQQILNASEEVLNTDTSRRSQLRSVVRTLLCACVFTTFTWKAAETINCAHRSYKKLLQTL